MSTLQHTTIRRRSAIAGIAVLLAACSSTKAVSTPAASSAPVATSTTQATVAAPTTTEAATTTSRAPALPGKLASYPAPVPGALPDGTYAVDITDADLAAVRDFNFPEDHGHFVWTLKAGIWSFVQTADNPLKNPADTGTYVVQGDHVKFYGATDDPGQEFTWVVNADGSLQFTYQASTQQFWAAAFGSHPLVPVP